MVQQQKIVTLAVGLCHGNLTQHGEYCVFSQLVCVFSLFKEIIICSEIVSVGKSDSLEKEVTFPGQDWTSLCLTEALLRLHSSRSVDGSLVHLRLRENMSSFFFFVRSCCINTNLDTWLVLLIQQQPAASPVPSDILNVDASILMMRRTGSRRLKAGRDEKKEEVLPDTAGMLNCLFGSTSALCTHVNLWRRARKSTLSQVL